MQRRVLLLLLVGALVAFPALAQAAVTITVGNHNLAPNTAGQTVDILISATAGEGLNSMDLDIVIDNFNVSGFAPTMTAADIQSGATLWGANATTLFPGLDPPTNVEYFQSVANNAAVNSPIGVSSVLARLTFDTNGSNPGVYALEVGRQDGAAPTVLQATGGQIIPTIIEGTLNIVPEPSTVVLGMFGVAALGMVALRRHRARRAA